MILRVYAILFSFIAFTSTAATIDKAKFLQNIEKAVQQPNFAYNAKINMKVAAQGFSILDSGTLHFSPPNRQKFELNVSKVKVTSIGDTSWTTMADGSVTRRVGSYSLSGANNSSPPNSTPNFASILKTTDFTITGDVSGKNILVEFFMSFPTGKQKIKAVFDTEEWLLRSYTLIGLPTGEITSNFTYCTVGKSKLVSEVRNVMGSAGVMTITITEYIVTKILPASAFRGM